MHTFIKTNVGLIKNNILFCNFEVILICFTTQTVIHNYYTDYGILTVHRLHFTHMETAFSLELNNYSS